MSATTEVPEFTIEQVAAHNREDDLWIIVHGEVYDVTKYVRDHPGGDDILIEIGGMDGTVEFDAAGHSDDAWDITKSLLVGKLKKGETQKLKRPETGRLIAVAPAAPIPPKPKQSGGSSRVLTTLSLGLGSSLAAFGLWWYTKQIDFTTLPKSVSFANTEFLRQALAAVKRKEFGFTDGLIVASTAFSLTLGAAVQRLGYILQYYSTHKAHMKIPRLPKRNVLNGRGWLDPTTFQKLPLVKKEVLSTDSYRFVFALPRKDMMVGLPIGQHVSIRGLVDGKLIQRSYTPISNNADRGILELVIKVYPNGALTNGYFGKLEVGDQVEFRGPKGGIRYIPGMCKKIGMVAGGTGITPMYQLIRAICENPRDTTEVSLIYANRSESDILLRKELDAFARKYPENVKIYYVLEQTPAGWQGGSGYVTRDMMEDRLPVPSATTKIFLCGPPPMIESVKKSLGSLGFKQPNGIAKPGDDVLLF
ncbi:NADH-cytochrome b5 reductase 1 [Talaromyces pinophilus]|nr:NADH-cytochrome b5 reductase 1 [Talaromyces pinophilus]